MKDEQKILGGPIGDLEYWIDSLKALGNVHKKNRQEMSEMLSMRYSSLCHSLRTQLLPLGLVEQDGWGRDKNGVRTYTFSVTPKGKALIGAIQSVESRYGELRREVVEIKSIAVRPERDGHHLPGYTLPHTFIPPNPRPK